MNFLEKLNSAAQRNGSRFCIGLDPDPERMPEKISVLEFNRAIIEATADIVCAYKPNFAFYEALSSQGIDTLKETIKAVPPGIPVIGDAKRGDIGNTARAYAKAIFESLGCDAATVSPYLGFDSVAPFIEYRDKGVFILCRTSNPSAEDFQSLDYNAGASSRRLFQIVADKASQWNTHGNIGLVVGATYPEELKLLREAHPDLPFLIPGVGAQGGDLALAVRYGVNAQGKGIILNSSRQVIYASRHKDFAQAARQVALELRDQINRCLPQPAP
ncbi:MAG: orotidine-5'-phosphate decarboxylase [Dehalococcoidales bacterium]|nr:orotidine-5'-phosphate decarboxylase [Dehalococcoidales bacterium]